MHQHTLLRSFIYQCMPIVNGLSCQSENFKKGMHNKIHSNKLYCWFLHIVTHLLVHWPFQSTMWLSILRIIGLEFRKRGEALWLMTSGRTENLFFCQLDKKKKNSSKDQRRNFIRRDCATNLTLGDVGVWGGAAASIVGHFLIYSLSRWVNCWYTEPE